MGDISVTCTHCGDRKNVVIFSPVTCFDTILTIYVTSRLIGWPDGWIHGISPEADFLDLCETCHDTMPIIEVITEMFFVGPLTPDAFYTMFSYDDIENYMFFKKSII